MLTDCTRDSYSDYEHVTHAECDCVRHPLLDIISRPQRLAIGRQYDYIRAWRMCAGYLSYEVEMEEPPTEARQGYQQT